MDVARLLLGGGLSGRVALPVRLFLVSVAVDAQNHLVLKTCHQPESVIIMTRSNITIIMNGMMGNWLSIQRS